MGREGVKEEEKEGKGRRRGELRENRDGEYENGKRREGRKRGGEAKAEREMGREGEE